MRNIWNPWHGCKRCSPGCEHCYMYFLDAKRGVAEESSVCRRTQNFDYPLRKYRNGQYKLKSGERLSVNMTSDTFLEDADSWRDEMWDIVRQRPDLIFWFLTKRPERILDHLPKDWGDGWDHVSLNVTCENQKMFDKRFPILETIPAKHKGLCLAPLIGPIDVTPACKSGWIDEISVGGENYDNPRPIMHDWVVDISNTCKKYGTNFCWYESGTRVIKDGCLYEIPYKSLQSKTAFFAGLNNFVKPIVYNLRLPDGSAVERGYQKCYNFDRCMFCSNQLMCNGCTGCGDCGLVDVALFSADVFFEEQNRRLVNLGRTDLCNIGG